MLSHLPIHPLVDLQQFLALVQDRMANRDALAVWIGIAVPVLALLAQLLETVVERMWFPLGPSHISPLARQMSPRRREPTNLLTEPLPSVPRWADWGPRGYLVHRPDFTRRLLQFWRANLRRSGGALVAIYGRSASGKSVLACEAASLLLRRPLSTPPVLWGVLPGLPENMQQLEDALRWYRRLCWLSWRRVGPALLCVTLGCAAAGAGLHQAWLSMATDLALLLAAYHLLPPLKPLVILEDAHKDWGKYCSLVAELDRLPAVFFITARRIEFLRHGHEPVPQAWKHGDAANLVETSTDLASGPHSGMCARLELTAAHYLEFAGAVIDRQLGEFAGELSQETRDRWCRATHDSLLHLVLLARIAREAMGKPSHAADRQPPPLHAAERPAVVPPSDDRLLDRLRGFMLKRLESLGGPDALNVEPVVVSAAIFGYEEVLAPKAFLVDVLGYSNDELERLTSLGELTQPNDGEVQLGLPHAGVAQLLQTGIAAAERTLYRAEGPVPQAAEVEGLYRRIRDCSNALAGDPEAYLRHRGECQGLGAAVRCLYLQWLLDHAVSSSGHRTAVVTLLETVAFAGRRPSPEEVAEALEQLVGPPDGESTGGSVLDRLESALGCSAAAPTVSVAATLSSWLRCSVLLPAMQKAASGAPPGGLLLWQLASGVASTRAAAICHLERAVAAPPSAEALAQPACEESPLEVRVAILSASPDPVQALVAALRDQRLRAAAAEGLSMLGAAAADEVVPLLNEPALLEVAFGILTGMGSAASRALQAAVARADATVGTLAAVALGCTADDGSVGALSWALGSDDPNLQAEAVQSLAQIGAPDTPELLLPLLSDGTAPPFVRESAAEALGHLGASSAVAALTDVLADPGAGNWLRGAAAWALGRTRAASAVAPLVAALSGYDAWEGLSQRAAQALGRTLGGAAMQSPLVSSLSTWSFAGHDWGAETSLPARNGVPVAAARLTHVLADRAARQFLRERAAVEGYAGDADALATVTAVLSDWEAGVRLRETAARALGRIGDRAAAAPLVALVSGRRARKDLRETARQALRQLPRDAAVACLVRLLTARRPARYEQEHVRMALAEIVGEAALRPLEGVLLPRRPLLLPPEAAYARTLVDTVYTSMHGTLRPRPLLLTREAFCARVLVEAVHTPRDVCPPWVSEAIHAGSSPGRELAGLICTLQDPLADSELRRSSVWPLGSIGAGILTERWERRFSPGQAAVGIRRERTPRNETALAALADALQDPCVPARVRTCCVWALRAAGDEAAVAPLVRLLREPEAPAGLRLSGAWALEGVQAPAAVAALIDTLTDRSAPVELRVLVAQISGRSATDELLTVVNDEEEPVELRIAAVRALGEAARDALARVCDNPDAPVGVRTAAAGVRAESGDPSAVSVLIRLLSEGGAPEPTAEPRARTGETAPPVEAGAPARAGANGADAPRVAGESVPAAGLLATLNDRAADQRKQRAAVQALGEVGGATAVAALAGLLGDREVPTELRLAVAGALTQTGDPAAIPPLVSVLRDPDAGTWLRAEVASALGRCPAPAGLEQLTQVLEDSDEGELLRAAAADALGARGDLVALPLLLALQSRLRTARQHGALEDAVSDAVQTCLYQLRASQTTGQAPETPAPRGVSP